MKQYDEYCVIGHPVAHSLSPRIHALFAGQTGQNLHYAARLAPLDGFTASVVNFMAGGGRGANVTVPFKGEAFELADSLSSRAQVAGAVNTLSFVDGRIQADNTDGAGLVRDLVCNLGLPLAGMHILLLGAGGAACGVIGPLLGDGADDDLRSAGSQRLPASLTIANRTPEKAVALAEKFSRPGLIINGLAYAQLEAEMAGQAFDLIINATSASLAGETLPLAADIFTNSVAYDMMYGRGKDGLPAGTPFLRQAAECGAARLADGLGMLVEQAAEAFYLWRGVRPQTAPVLAALRG